MKGKRPRSSEIRLSRNWSRSHGGYSPETIVLKKNVPARIIFNRKDPSSCLDQVIFPDFGVHEALPLGEKHVIEITPEKAGEYGYSCGMNMMHGHMIVE